MSHQLRPGSWLPGPDESASVVLAIEDVAGEGPCGVLYGPAQILVSRTTMGCLAEAFPFWIEGEGIPSEPLWMWPQWSLEQRIALGAAIGSPRGAAYILTCAALALKTELPRQIKWQRWGKNLLSTLATGSAYYRDPAAHQIASLIEGVDRVGQCAEGGSSHNVSLVPLKYACAYIVEAGIWSEARICAWIVDKFPFRDLREPWTGEGKENR